MEDLVRFGNALRQGKRIAFAIDNGRWPKARHYIHWSDGEWREYAYQPGSADHLAELFCRKLHRCKQPWGLPSQPPFSSCRPRRRRN